MTKLSLLSYVLGNSSLRYQSLQKFADHVKKMKITSNWWVKICSTLIYISKGIEWSAGTLYCKLFGYRVSVF